MCVEVEEPMTHSALNTSKHSGVVKAWIVTVLLIVAVIVVVAVSQYPGPASNSKQLPVSVTPGSFGSLTFTSLDGASVPMSRYLGKPMLVEIWATWCGPCVKARKELHALAAEAEPYAGLVALSVDRGGANVVRDHLAKKKEPPTPWVDLMADDPRFRSVIGPHDVRATIPKLIFVDARGRIVDIEYGIPDREWVLNRLKALSSAGARG
ncbi:MAG TPA: hypothetical protein DCX60_02205 [Phycisphaerales bacterium]|nr:hypothetical protein [Phycisphaerales bacterium]